MLKRLLNSPLAQTLVGRILGFYMHVCGWTTRWTLVNRAAPEALWKAGGPVVICFWHGRIVLSHRGWATPDKGAQPARVLISHSREGGIVTAATRTVGHDVIRGSSAKGDKRKGAVEAMRQMLRHMGEGGAIAMAPDGPRGPRMRAQMGPIQLARRMNAPIIPFGWSSSACKVFNSWDRFVLPYPFGKGVMIWGEPIRVAPDADEAGMERARAALEAELNRVTLEADRQAGAVHVEPAEAPLARAPLEPAAQ
ncbi:MAG: lysophospholipid acyltransferase family protein [Hyphomonadaceae bacterium]